VKDAPAPAPGDPLHLSMPGMFAMCGAAVEARRRGDVAGLGELHVLLGLLIPPDAAELPGLGAVELDDLRADVRAQLDA
jgi:hypothetical protein